MSATDLLRAALSALVAEEGDVTAALSAALDLLASETGAPAVRHAAAVVRGDRHPGRPPAADDEALSEVADLIASGRRASVAISIISRRKATAAATAESVARRLRGKLRKADELGFIQPFAS